MLRAIFNFQNSMLPRKIAWGVLLGKVLGFVSARAAHSSITPFGCDRLILNPDGQAAERVRIHRGVRLILDPQTLEVRERHHVKGTGSLPKRFKMKDQKSVFVPGDKSLMGVVNWIWERHYLDGWGANRIANTLNQQGTLPSEGRIFRPSSVKAILHNSIYLGWSELGHSTGAKFYRLGKKLPQTALVDQATLEGLGRACMPRMRNKRSECLYREEPLMRDFIKSEQVRRKALPSLNAYWDTFHERGGYTLLKGMKVRNNRHPKSSYLLSGILHTKASHFPMSAKGVSKGRSPCYAAPDATSEKPKGHHERRALLAPQIHIAVLEVLRHVFSNCKDRLTSMLMGFVQEGIDQTTLKKNEIPMLEKQLERRKGKLAALLEMNDELEPREWSVAVTKQRTAIKDLTDRLASLRGSVPTVSRDGR